MTKSVTINSRAFERRLNKIARGVKDFKKPLNEIGDNLIKFYGDENFEKQGVPLGKKWEPLSVFTLQSRARKTGHYSKPSKQQNKILIWTGKLQKGFIKRVGKFKVTVSNKVSYFKFNQRERTMLAINDKVVKIVLDTIGKHVKKITNQ